MQIVTIFLCFSVWGVEGRERKKKEEGEGRSCAPQARTNMQEVGRAKRGHRWGGGGERKRRKGAPQARPAWL